MSVVWYVEYEGLRRPIVDWGIEKASLSFGSQVTDEFRFEVGDESPTSDPRFAYGKKIVLWRNTVRWFTGTITQSPWSGSPQADRQSYIASGPWWDLEQIIFQQPRWALADANDPSRGVLLYSSTSVVIFQSPGGIRFTVGDQMHEVIDYAISKHVNMTRGTFSFDIYAPWEKGLDLSCAELVKRCLRWSKDAATWWDYSTEVPRLNIGRRADLAALTLDLNAGAAVTSHQIIARDDLQPRAVRFIYLSTKQDEQGNQWIDLTNNDAGAYDGGVKNIVVTIQLSGIGAAAEPIPVGLATAYYNGLSQLQWQGSVGITEDECSGSARPGMVINLTNGKSAWATMRALVQSVEEDIVTGSTTVEFGPPEQLGPQDYQTLASFRRGPINPDSGNAPSSRFDGTPPTKVPPQDPTKPPPAPPSDPSQPPPSNQNNAIELEICVDGTPRKLWVQGAFKP